MRTHRSGARRLRSTLSKGRNIRDFFVWGHIGISGIRNQKQKDSNSRGLGLYLTQGGNFYLQHWTFFSWLSFSAPRVGPGCSQLAPNTVQTGHLGTDEKHGVRGLYHKVFIRVNNNFSQTSLLEHIKVGWILIVDPDPRDPKYRLISDLSETNL